MNVLDYLVKSKEIQLWLVINKELDGIIRDFKSKIRAYFSNQQREVIHNIKNKNFNFYDYDKYINKFINIYNNQLKGVFDIAYKRCVIESGVDNKNLYDVIYNSYKDSDVVRLVSLIEINTLKKLNELYKEYLKNNDINEFINNINNFYNSYCKGFRAKTISKTEVFRMYNFFYLSYMSINGYPYKKWIAGIRDKNSKVRSLDGQIKYYIEDFILYEYGLSCVHPPIHPNDNSILICLKSNINT